MFLTNKPAVIVLAATLVISTAAQAGFFLVETKKTAPSSEGAASVTPSVKADEKTTPVIASKETSAPKSAGEKNKEEPPVVVENNDLFNDLLSRKSGSVIYVVGELIDPVPAIGYGKNVSLIDAFRQIVPNEYAVEIRDVPQADLERKVEWRSDTGPKSKKTINKPWPEVLRELLSRVQMRAVVYVDAKKVLFVSNEYGHQKTVHGKAIWRVKAGDRMSTTLAAWGRAAGWQGVVWEAPEIVSEMDISFTGDFIEAVIKLVEAISNGTTTRIHARVYEGNKVVQIMEKR